MISRRNFFTITIIMFVLFFLFQFSGVVKETWNDYETNEYADQTESTYTAQDASADSGQQNREQGRYAVYIGTASDDALGAVVSQWGAYTKRDVETYETLEAYPFDPNDLPEVILLDSNALNWDTDAELLHSYVEQGANLIFCNLPEPSVIQSNTVLKNLLGIRQVKSDNTKIDGVHLFAGLLLGGETRYIVENKADKNRQDLNLNIPWYQISSGTKSYMVGMMETEDIENEDLPAIIWRNSIGEARVFAVNGSYLEDNTGIGILDGMMVEMNSYELYPVINAQNLVIVNYPDLASENEEEMQERYSRSLKAVLRDIVWPGIAAVSEKNNLKLTCLLSPQLDYADESSPDAGELIYYLKLFREQDAETGLSASHISDTDIVSKLKQDDTFLSGQIPGYAYLSFYADQLTDAEIDQALSQKLLGSVKTLYTDDSENGTLISYAADDVTRQSATVDGFRHTYSDDLRVKSLESALGYSSILVNMERLIYPESDSDSWEKLYEKFSSNTDTYWKSYTSFTQTTLSESDERIRAFLAMNYSDSREGDTITLDISGFTTDAWYLLRTHGEEITSIEGGSYEKLEEDAYLIAATDSQVNIHLGTQEKFYYDKE